MSYQYEYAQYTAADFLMLSEAMTAIGKKYSEDIAQEALEMLEGGRHGFPPPSPLEGR